MLVFLITLLISIIAKSRIIEIYTRTKVVITIRIKFNNNILSNSRIN